MKINNFMIFGDSYSTHKNHIPDGFAYYYADEGRNEGRDEQKMLVEQTWWWQFKERTGATLVHNNSWSGSTIGYTGYSGDCSKTSSFICRYDKLVDSGFFKDNDIDTVLVFGGTNDDWSGAPLGEMKFSDFKREDLFSVLPAICYFMTRLKSDLPNANVVFIANCGIKKEIVECMKKIAEKLDVKVVELSDIDKQHSHPTILGMTQICDQIIAQLDV